MRGLNTAGQGPRKQSLMVHLPVLAVKWFQDVERISGGLIHLRFNPDEVIEAIRASEYTADSWKVVMMNSKWNLIWGRYCLAILEKQFYPMIKYGFNNVIRYNRSFLEGYDEKEPTIEPQPIGLTGIMGFDLIAGDLVANSYVDAVWGELVDGLGSITKFRANYIQATATPRYIDKDTALLAKSIALAEINWANEFFPFRDVSDLITFESVWQIRFFTGMMDNFIVAANLAGAGLPQLKSWEIIRKIATNPETPIEEVIA